MACLFIPVLIDQTGMNILSWYKKIISNDVEMWRKPHRTQLELFWNEQRNSSWAIGKNDAI